MFTPNDGRIAGLTHAYQAPRDPEGGACLPRAPNRPACKEACRWPPREWGDWWSRSAPGRYPHSVSVVEVRTHLEL